MTIYNFYCNSSTIDRLTGPSSVVKIYEVFVKITGSFTSAISMVKLFVTESFVSVTVTVKVNDVVGNMTS